MSLNMYTSEKGIQVKEYASEKVCKWKKYISEYVCKWTCMLIKMYAC